MSEAVGAADHERQSVPLQRLQQLHVKDLASPVSQFAIVGYTGVPRAAARDGARSAGAKRDRQLLRLALI